MGTHSPQGLGIITNTCEGQGDALQLMELCGRLRPADVQLSSGTCQHTVMQQQHHVHRQTAEPQARTAVHQDQSSGNTTMQPHGLMHFYPQPSQEHAKVTVPLFGRCRWPIFGHTLEAQPPWSILITRKATDSRVTGQQDAGFVAAGYEY